MTGLVPKRRKPMTHEEAVERVKELLKRKRRLRSYRAWPVPYEFGVPEEKPR